jgi:hypothetical protein
VAVDLLVANLVTLAVYDRVWNELARPKSKRVA